MSMTIRLGMQIHTGALLQPRYGYNNLRECFIVSLSELKPET